MNQMGCVGKEFHCGIMVQLRLDCVVLDRARPVLNEIEPVRRGPPHQPLDATGGSNW